MMESLIINIDVPDLTKGVALYCAGLGFTRARSLFGGSVVELRSAAGAIFLIEQPAGSLPIPTMPIQRDYAPHWTPVHLDLPVTNLDVAVAKATAAGATNSGPVTSQIFGQLAPMRDPFGHGFCLIEFNSDAYDAIS